MLSSTSRGASFEELENGWLRRAIWWRIIVLINLLEVYTMRNKLCFLISLIFLFGISTGVFAQDQQDEERGFYFQFGLGFAGTSYPDEYEQLLDALEDAPGVDRTRVNIHLAVGYAITQNLYGIFLIDGTGDRLDDGVDYIQTNTYFFNAGVRYYPFDTGLVLGAHLGPSRIVLDTDFAGSASSDMGFGGGIMFGYDFDRTLTGFSGILGIRLNGASIEGDSVGTAALFLSLLWK